MTGEVAMSVRVQAGDFDVGQEVARLRAHERSVGAIAAFIGTVRDVNDAASITGMTLEHYPGMTEAALEDIVDEARQRFDIVHVDFFDRHAATTSALAALALRTGAAVIPVFAHPLPDGRYRFVYESPVQAPDGDGPDAIREFTQRCTDVLEMHVRTKPHLWLWMHRRWRDAPTPDTPGMFPKARNEDDADE